MIRKWMGAVSAALVAAMLVVQPVLAAGETPARPSYGLSCVAGVCTARINLGIRVADLGVGGAWLQVMESALRELPGGVGLAVTDDVTLTLPAGQLQLADADLVLTLDEAGNVARLRGSAAAPLPTFGLLGDMQLVTPARVDVGYDVGANLSALNAPLDPARHYLFLDFQAGMQLASNGATPMNLATAQGQRATLVVDVVQPLVYVDGLVTLRTDGQLAFIRELVGPVADAGWLPTELPLAQSTSLHIQGQVGQGIEPKLTMGAGYRMDGGMVGRWLQIDATPLLAQGHAVITPAGLLLAGEARSALAPDKLLDTGAQAEVFVPFVAADAASASATVDATLPALGLEAERTGTVAGEPGWLVNMAQTTWQKTWQGVQTSATQVGATLQSTAQSGYGWMAGGVSSGWGYTHAQWCGLTGLCAPAEVAETAEESVRVAAAE